MMRPAEQEDWPLIAQWRDAHFADMRSRMNVPREILGQKEFADAVWVVWEKRDVWDGHRIPVAALSFTQDDANKVRWIHDLYAAQTHAVAGLKLSMAFERYCDQDGYEIRGCTDPENTQYLEIVAKRGYEFTAVEFRRRPRPVIIETPIREEHLHGVHQ